MIEFFQLNSSNGPRFLLYPEFDFVLIRLRIVFELDGSNQNTIEETCPGVFVTFDEINDISDIEDWTGTCTDLDFEIMEQDVYFLLTNQN